ncbi:cysteine methyltransferase [Shewanella sp. OPT22]|nr:cysteine methyltransferase [Shewanella sp. OPT22]
MTSNEKILFVVNLIPEGNVFTYGKVADLAGLPGRSRMVSKALKQAPRSMLIPWHRVINSQGKISIPKDTKGYREQIELLRIEGIEINNGRIKLADYEWRPDLATLVMDIPF